MRMALKDVQVPVDYINPHATSTPIGDLREMEGESGRCSARDTPPVAANQGADRAIRSAPPGAQGKPSIRC